MAKIWLQKRRGGFYLRSEPATKGRTYWLGFMEPNGDTHELRITVDIWRFIKNGRSE